MKNARTYLKLAMINVFVLLILLWSLNFIASIYLDGKYLYKQVFVPIDEKAYRASLADREKAIRFYREKKTIAHALCALYCLVSKTFFLGSHKH